MPSLIEIILRGKGNAAQSVRNLRKETQGLGKQSGIASKLVGGLGAAMAGIASLAVIKQVARAGLELAKIGAQAESVSRAFEGLGGSIEALREGSLGLISDVDLMKQFNTAAQLVSKTFAEDLPEAMGFVSKVAAATGQSMSFMMDSLVRGVGRMSPLILDNLGIQVDLAAATKRSAEMFGVQADELSKAQQQAGLMAEVMDKLRENTAAMPEIAGSAAAGFGGMGAEIGNLRIELGLLLLEFTQFQGGIGGVIGSAKELVAGVRENISVSREWTNAMNQLRDAGLIAREDLLALRARFSDLQLAFTAGKFTLAEYNEQVSILTESARKLGAEAANVSTVVDRWAVDLLKATNATKEHTSAIELDRKGIQKWLDELKALKVAATKLWAEVFDPSALRSAMSRWNDIVDTNMDKAFRIIDQHQDREREAQFQHQADRILSLANFEAEKAALLDAGRDEDAARLTDKFNAEAATANAAFANQQGLLDRNLLVQQVARARAWVAELKAQDTKIRLSLTAMVLEAGATLDLKAGVERGMLDLIKEGATAQLGVQIEHAKSSADIATALGKQQIGAAEEMMVGIIAALNLQSDKAKAALGRLQDNLSRFTDNFLDNIRTTFGGDIGIGDIGDRIADGARRTEETVTRALADVARDIDTAISKMLSSIEALQDVEIPEGLDEAFAKLGQFFQKSVAAVHSWIDAPGVKKKLDEIRDFLGVVIDLFDFINIDLNKIKPFEGNFIPSADQFFRQLKAFSGRVFDWMTNDIGPDLQKAVALAADISDDVARLFKLVGPDMSKVVPATGAFIPKADRYIAQLKAFSGRAFRWMDGIILRELEDAVAAAGVIAEDVARLFKLLGPDMSKVIPAGGAFIPKADRYIQQLQAWSGRVFDWMRNIISRDLGDAVKEAADLSEDVAKLFGILVDMSAVVPAPGGFIPKADRYFQQLRAFSGRVFDWMRNIIARDLQGAVGEAGDLAEDVKKLFGVLDIGFGNIGNTAAILAGLRNMDLYFFTLDQMGRRIMDWLGNRDEATQLQVARAAELSENVQTLFGLLNIATDVPELKPGFEDKFTGFVDKLQGMLDHALPIFEAIQRKWGESGVLGLAANVVENVQAIFGGFASIIQSIESAANLGGLDVSAAWAMMMQFQDLLNPPAGVIAPSPADIANVGVGGVEGGAGGGVAIVVHDWRIILEIPQLNAVAEGHVTDEVAAGARAAEQITLTLVAASV